MDTPQNGDPPAPVYAVVYLSTALKPFSAADLMELLEKSRRSNEKRGISGMLLYKNRHFMQALEGPEAEVRALVEIIRHDPRHFGFVVLLEEQAEERHFSDWSMGFQNLETADLTDLPGYQEFADLSLAPERFLGNPPLAQKLLSAFWRKMMV